MRFAASTVTGSDGSQAMALRSIRPIGENFGHMDFES
jgi:hypothetical protein